MSKIIFAASCLLAVCLASPTPDKPQRSYSPPQNQYSPPQRRYEPPQPKYEAPEPPRYEAPQPRYEAPQPRYQAPDSYESTERPQYDFDWLVKDDYSGSNDFGQQETRDGYDTQGSYYVNLPDGRRQTVTYYVNGDSGYVAEVSYEGEAHYPEVRAYEPRSFEHRSFEQRSYEDDRSLEAPRQTYQQPQRRYDF